MGFTGYYSLMGAELPTSVVARCYADVGVYSSDLADCEAEEEPPASTPAQCQEYVAGRYEGGEPHGTAVAESLIDIAPHATLYIANPGSWGDLQETAAWMADQGVTVINYSVGWVFHGPGDGTSPFSNSPFNTVDQAVARGITWVNSAGNAAGDTWLGSYSDADGDGAIEFTDSGAEINPIDLRECRRYTFALRWDDNWDAAGTDLDIYLWDRSTGDILEVPAGWGHVGSRAPQSGASGDIPLELFSLRSPINSTDVGVIIVHDSGPVPDWIHLELFSGPGGLGYSTDGGSIGTPAESASPGLLAVGAAHYWETDTAVTFYSSQGPTPDGRIKPDIVGTDCAATVSYEVSNPASLGGNDCWFPGTSQASPHVAGLAALVKQRFPYFTPDQVADYLKHYAEQRATPDPNNTWGHGFAVLPDPGAEPPIGFDTSCGQVITGDDPVSGQWAVGCESAEEDRGHARYYSFTLEQESEVTIDLTSSVDTYLYLRDGDSRTGATVEGGENDDIVEGNTDSQIEATLGAGSYTIEATTYAEGETGSFTLTVSGLSGTAGPSTGTGECVQELPSTGTVSGIWAEGCESEARDGRYARYYTFTVDEPSEVTITLERTAGEPDTYLNLWSDAVRTGTPHAFDDDSPDTSRSEISQNLSAGDYTIEATTYAVGETGGFTLTVSGLGTTTPGPEPTDDCGETLTGDGSVSGTWAAGCDSDEREGRYARYYTFDIEEATEVTIILESDDADTYLNLWSGSNRTGTPVASDDDSPDTSRSEIQETLAAGSYTIEATTYAEGETGDFTLTVSGLGGSTTTPDPTTDPCGDTITADGEVSGAWTTACDSTERDGRHARYYSFTLDQESEVTIDLTSDVDTYLYLRSGDATSGSALHEDDDGGDGTNSRIRQTLASGTYTIEATTYSAGATGSFTLAVSGLGGSTTAPDPTTDPCGDTITADGEVSGAWASGCDSTERDSRHARYYSFTLAEGGEVTINLTSDVDTYLYLREGDSRTGATVEGGENDDIESGNTDSRIVATLEEGSYTIEATTYAAGASGSFTLTVSGLGGGT